MRLLTAPGGQPEDEAAVNLSWKSDDRTKKRISAKLEPTKITLDTNGSIIFYICLTQSRTVGWTVGRARLDGQPDR